MRPWTWGGNCVTTGGASFSSTLLSDGGELLCAMSFDWAGILPGESVRDPNISSGLCDPPGSSRARAGLPVTFTSTVRIWQAFVEGGTEHSAQTQKQEPTEADLKVSHLLHGKAGDKLMLQMRHAIDLSPLGNFLQCVSVWDESHTDLLSDPKSMKERVRNRCWEKLSSPAV